MTTAYQLPKYISIFNPFHRQYTSNPKKKTVERVMKTDQKEKKKK